MKSQNAIRTAIAALPTAPESVLGLLIRIISPFASSSVFPTASKFSKIRRLRVTFSEDPMKRIAADSGGQSRNGGAAEEGHGLNRGRSQQLIEKQTQVATPDIPVFGDFQAHSKTQVTQFLFIFELADSQFTEGSFNTPIITFAHPPEKNMKIQTGFT
jgi:hypothetical protein